MTDWAIGDLHGCLDEFDALLRQINFDPDSDSLWLTGDLINRGPKCLDTLRRVHALHQHMGPRLQVVLGNHDLHLLACWAGIRQPGKRDTLLSILNADDATPLCDWLRAQPLLHACGSHILVHAGLHPSLSLVQHRKLADSLHCGLSGSDPGATLRAVYSARPAHVEPNTSPEQTLAYAAAVFTRMRGLNTDLSLNFDEKGPPDSFPNGVTPWFAPAAGHFAGLRIHTGHWAALGYGVHGPVIALDGGCVWGGDLVAVNRNTPDQPYRVRRGPV